LPRRLAQNPPFRFVDRVLESDPPRRCVTQKIFSADEVLLEGAEVVPAALVAEALCQSAAFLSPDAAPGSGRIVLMEEAEMTRQVRPGDRLVVTSRLLEESAAALKAECVGEVEGAPVARLKVLIRRGGS
jgi:3-hydroxymyristoyl/3-hydroxydecanoyl-(acyl carrier protein) dehydratase